MNSSGDCGIEGWVSFNVIASFCWYMKIPYGTHCNERLRLSLDLQTKINVGTSVQYGRARITSFPFFFGTDT